MNNNLEKNENNHSDNEDDLYDQQQDKNNCEQSFKISSNFDELISKTTNNPLNQPDFEKELDRMIEVASFDLPKSLIITNMDSRIFDVNSPQRADFEKAFRHLDPGVNFFYFKSFRRARLDFTDNQLATKARIILNQVKFGDEAINCYFAEVADTSTNEFLKPPALEKQFLISPPASPPEGWEPSEEAQPILNIDLQSALANLMPGSTHELHPPSNDQPGIVVHICSDTASTPTIQQPIDDDDNGEGIKIKTKIAHTPCPPSMQKLRQQ